MVIFAPQVCVLVHLFNWHLVITMSVRCKITVCLCHRRLHYYGNAKYLLLFQWIEASLMQCVYDLLNLQAQLKNKQIQNLNV
jgi:hypothetical protein